MFFVQKLRLKQKKLANEQIKAKYKPGSLKMQLALYLITV